MAAESRLRLITALVAASGTQALAYALAALVATRVLPVADRGLMVAALTIASLVSPIAALGTGNSLRSQLPQAGKNLAVDLVASYTRVSARLSVLGSIAAICTSVFLSFIADESLRSIAVLIAVGLSTFALVTLQQVTEAWFAAGRYRAGARWSSGAAIVGLLGLGFGYVVDNSAASLMIGQAAGILGVVVFATRSANRHGVVLLAAATPTRVGQLVRRGTRSIGLPIGTALALRSDRLILAAIVGSETVAVYALAATVAEAVRLAPTAAGQLVTRDVAERPHGHRVLRSQLDGLIGVAVVGIPVLVLSHELFVPIFGDAYARSASLLNVLLLAELGFSLFIISQRGLLGGGWNWDVTVIGIAGGTLALPVYLIAATMNGAMGCAWGAVLVYTLIGMAGSVAFSRRIRSLDHAATRETEVEQG